MIDDDILEIKNQMLDTNRVILEIRDLLKDTVEGIKEWKEWDRKHHLEEIETKRMVTELIKKNG